MLNVVVLLKENVTGYLVIVLASLVILVALAVAVVIK